jgi:hypothetical protein
LNFGKYKVTAPGGHIVKISREVFEKSNVRRYWVGCGEGSLKTTLWKVRKLKISFVRAT